MSQEDTSIQLTFRNVFHVDVVFPKAHVLERCSGRWVQKLRYKLVLPSYVFHIFFSVKFIEVVQYL